MNIPLLVFSALSVCVGTLSAQDAPSISFTTAGGREYRNVTVVRTVGRSLECMTTSGLQRVPIVQLPEEMRARYADVLAKHPSPKIGDRISFQCVNGSAFKNVVLLRVEPDGLSIATDAGVHKVSFDLVNEEFRQLFDFEEAAAAEYKEAQTVAKTEAAVREARAQAAAREAEARAAAEKELANRARAEARAAAANEVGPAPLGTAGAERLGSPKLGGAGQTR